jgi:4-aminobutyrate aminotransferase/(S)-3-amino-2-methylpropionate transaminase
MTAVFSPQVLSEEEITSLLSQVSDEEIAQAREFSLTPLKSTILHRGEPGGALVYDYEGNAYLDCTAQAWTLNVGYCNPDVLATVAEQMKYLTHVRYAYPTIPRIKLINRLSTLFPGEPRKVCLNVQGGGATIEAAMKLAMVNKPGADVFLVASHGYHGASLAMLTASQYFPYITRFPLFGRDHFVRFSYPYCYRCPLDRELRTCGLACLNLVENAIRHHYSTSIAGLIIEPMQGAGGQVPTPPGYLAGLREICDKRGIFLIFDESQTACGRIGVMSAAEYYSVMPDMFVLTKGLGGGFPVGALVARADLKRFTAVEEHTTFGADPVPFAAALANIAVIEGTGLCERTRALGERATAYLRHLQEEYDIIGDVRCPGLFIGVELVEDRESKAPATALASAFVEMAKKLGVIFDVSMPDIVDGRPSMRNVIKIKPPLTITDEQLDRALETFRLCTEQVSKIPDEMKEMILQRMMAEAIPEK